MTVLAFHAYADNQLSGAVALTAGGLSNPVINRDEQMLTVITVMLVTLAALNALFTTWAMVLDARRSSALMQALVAIAVLTVVPARIGTRQPVAEVLESETA